MWIKCFILIIFFLLIKFSFFFRKNILQTHDVFPYRFFPRKMCGCLEWKCHHNIFKIFLKKIILPASSALIHPHTPRQIVSAIHSFFLAMAYQPTIAKKAESEINSIISPDHLPHFTDCPNLLYIDTLVKEVFWWHAVTPHAIRKMWVST